MELPRIDPVGLVRVPDGYSRTPRRYPPALRIAALALVAAFLTAGTLTTVLSLGRYCLTTDASNTGSLPTSQSGRSQ